MYTYTYVYMYIYRALCVLYRIYRAHYVLYRIFSNTHMSSQKQCHIHTDYLQNTHRLHCNTHRVHCNTRIDWTATHIVTALQHTHSLHRNTHIWLHCNTHTDCAATHIWCTSHKDASRPVSGRCTTKKEQLCNSSAFRVLAPFFLVFLAGVFWGPRLLPSSTSTCLGRLHMGSDCSATDCIQEDCRLHVESCCSASDCIWDQIAVCRIAFRKIVDCTWDRVAVRQIAHGIK